MFFAGIIRLEFANAQTILMLVPFAVTLVASRRLGEQVSAQRYGLIALGSIGVVAVVRPTPGDFSPWALLVVVAALFWCCESSRLVGSSRRFLLSWWPC